MAMKTWNSLKNSAEDALYLPEGSYAANFGFWVEQTVEPNQVLEAAAALIKAKLEVTAHSRAKIICLAQEKKVAFQDWASLKTL